MADTANIVVDTVNVHAEKFKVNGAQKKIVLENNVSVMFLGSPGAVLCRLTPG